MTMSRNRLSWCGIQWMAVMVACSFSAWSQEPAPAVISPAPSEAAQPVASAPVVGQANPSPEWETDVSTSSCWMIGTRVTQFSLKDDTRGERFKDSFMGTITEIEAEQDNTPDKLFVQYRLPETVVWIGVSYDHIRAKTLDEGGTDGSVEISGFIPYLQARWENETVAVPYIEVGLAFYKADFEESDEWSDHGRRYVELDGSVMGREIAGGVAIQVYKGLSVDLYAQYMDVDDITGDYYINDRRDGDVIFTLSHVTYGIGAQVQF